jgi:hypothetical protein
MENKKSIIMKKETLNLILALIIGSIIIGLLQDQNCL